MSENIVLIGVGSVLAVFILFFLGMRTILSRGRASRDAGSAGVAGDSGSGLESGHDWHMRQNEQFGHHHHDHGGSFDGGSGGGDGGGGGGGGGGGD